MSKKDRAKKQDRNDLARQKLLKGNFKYKPTHDLDKTMDLVEEIIYNSNTIEKPEILRPEQYALYLDIKGDIEKHPPELIQKGNEIARQLLEYAKQNPSQPIYSMMPVAELNVVNQIIDKNNNTHYVGLITYTKDYDGVVAGAQRLCFFETMFPVDPKTKFENFFVDDTGDYVFGKGVKVLEPEKVEVIVERIVKDTKVITQEKKVGLDDTKLKKKLEKTKNNVLHPYKKDPLNGPFVEKIIDEFVDKLCN